MSPKTTSSTQAKRSLNKHEKRRITRQYARRVQGKNYLATPIVIAPAAQRKEALQRGNMQFYIGKQRIEIPLTSNGNLLNGIYKLANGTMVIFRADPTIKEIKFSQLVKSKTGLIEKPMGGSFSFEEDVAHMHFKGNTKPTGQALGLKAASLAERHVRSRSQGTHSQEASSIFQKLYAKLGYKVKKVDFNAIAMTKTGKHNPKNNLGEFHNIEAIDPKTGKRKTFYFKVK
jgi:hypothetical protein